MKRSSVLVAERYDTVSGRLTALWTSEPSVGSGWTPISVSDVQRARALAVWWNSTPALILLLNQRTRKLTYPKWSLAQLRQVRIPTPDNAGWDALADAWEKVRDMEFQPIQEAKRCEARRVIDEAAAAALDVNAETVAVWRAMLAAEPTVTNRRAGKAG